jgi:hypothetical protein
MAIIMKTFLIALVAAFGFTVLIAGLGIIGAPVAVAIHFALIALGGVAMVYWADSSVNASEPAE